MVASGDTNLARHDRGVRRGVRVATQLAPLRIEWDPVRPAWRNAPQVGIREGRASPNSTTSSAPCSPPATSTDSTHTSDRSRRSGRSRRPLPHTGHRAQFPWAAGWSGSPTAFGRTPHPLMAPIISDVLRCRVARTSYRWTRVPVQAAAAVKHGSTNPTDHRTNVVRKGRTTDLTWTTEPKPSILGSRPSRVCFPIWPTSPTRGWHRGPPPAATGRGLVPRSSRRLVHPRTVLTLRAPAVVGNGWPTGSVHAPGVAAGA